MPGGSRIGRTKDLRLLTPACTAWVAAWLAVAAPDLGVAAWLPATAAWTLSCGLAVALLLIRVGRRRRRRTESLLAAAVLATAAAALVTQSAAATASVRETTPLSAAAAESREVDVVVELTSAPRGLTTSPAAPWAAGEGPRVRYRAAVVAVGGVRVPQVTASVVSPADPGLVFGASAAFRARVDTASAAEPASFRLRPTGEIVTSSPKGAYAWPAALRSGFADAAARLGGDGGALVPGLAIGDTSAVGPRLDADMKVSSLTHLTAVSGANCAIVTALAFAFTAALGAPRFVRIAAALAALACFVALVTPESSVVRAAVMAVVVLLASAVGRPGGGVAALSLAVIALLTVDPWYARDYGFALSVFATAGLLLLAGPLGAQLARVMPRWLATALAVPTAAQLACQPVLILLDPAIASYGVIANLLAGPAAPVGTMVGLAGCLILPVLPSVGVAALQIAAVPAEWIALVAHGVASLPVARLPWVADAAGAVMLAVGTAVGVWLLLGRRRRPWVVRTAVAVLLSTIAVPLGVSVGGPVLRRASLPADWIVAACDVGQGDAVLVRDGGAIALIDTGPDELALSHCLDLVGVDRIDLLVLTHWDADHVAAVGAVAGKVGTVLHGPLDGARSARALTRLADGGAAAQEVSRGAHGRLGSATWRVVWPPAEQAPGNDASVVLDLQTADFRGVFLGDLGESAQDRMRRDGASGPVDLVKVAHHGSADQSAVLYAELDATVGIIGVGADNGYGHPTDSLLELLSARRTSIVRTDRSGTTLLAVERGGFRAWTERDPDTDQGVLAAAHRRAPPRTGGVAGPPVTRPRGPPMRGPRRARAPRPRIRCRGVRRSPARTTARPTTPSRRRSSERSP